MEDTKQRILEKSLELFSAKGYNALNLSNPTTGAQPDRIRRRAMELGGKENRKIRWINY